jgi:sulfate permease, SulP family
MVVNGSLSKTAVNGSAGARAQLSGLIVAALTILTLIALTGLFEDLAEATLAAIERLVVERKRVVGARHVRMVGSFGEADREGVRGLAPPGQKDKAFSAASDEFPKWAESLCI